MRAPFLIAAALLCWAGIAQAQVPYPYPKSFSIELGTGLPPLHTSLLAPSRSVREQLAQSGQDINLTGAFYPVINLTGIYRSTLHSEYTLNLGVSWCHHRVTQYSVFGTDPKGQPRYDLDDGSPAGWKDSTPIGTLTFQYRYLYNPHRPVVVYSALGFGFSTHTSYLPLPSLTPIAARYGGEHFYGFLECTLGPLASFVHGGLGWRF